MHYSVKWLLLAFVAGFILPRAYGDFGLASSTDASSDYDEYETVDEALKAYHLATNTITNYYLENLMNEDAAQNGYVNFPPEDGTCEAMGSNVSTYCLAVILNDNLVEFEKYLLSHKNELDTSTSNTEDEAAPVTLDEALQQATEQRRTFEDQKEAAEDALDLTLAIYNQVQVVYPIHKELLTTISDLEDYRSNLAAIRDIIEKYPSKFNGASTAQCK